MNIERMNGFGGPSAAGGGQPLPRPGSKSADVKKAADDADLATSSGVDFTKMAQKAPDVNPDAVTEARRLLESGQLSSPDAIRRAAESMLRQGI
jgi:hypothetical protein